MNGKFYFYFSNGSQDTGVMVGDHPAGPFKDALGKPLLDKSLTLGKEFDSSVLVDDGVPYMVFGDRRGTSGDVYYMVRLNADMISLAETPRPVPIIGEFAPTDKPCLHKRNGLYYLSAGANYTVSDTIYGPYTVRRNEGGGTTSTGSLSRHTGTFLSGKINGSLRGVVL